MATHQDFVEYVRVQSGLGEAICCRRMFGEYAIWVEGKVVAPAGCSSSRRRTAGALPEHKPKKQRAAAGRGPTPAHDR